MGSSKSRKRRTLDDLLRDLAPSDSSRPSTSISGILLITTERLHTETARANAAERQATDLMSLFKNTHDQKLKLESDLLRVKEELSLYKAQLDAAQKEIFRAQEIVERIDRQRVDAEASAVRAREKSRKLAQARAVDQAIEDGRRLGFEQGLNQGRFLAQIESDRHQIPSSSSSHKSKHTTRSKRSESLSSRPEEITIQNTTPPIQKQSPPASRRSLVLPPDNYIPILNPDSTITLPPPHELTMPLPAEPVPITTSAASYRDQYRDHPRSTTPPSPSPRRDPPDPERLIPKQPPSQSELLSPATYPIRPPLRRREIIMPVPSQSPRPSTSQSTTPLRPIRTPSNTSIPGIQVQTPSSKSPDSAKTTYDPILLTPDQSKPSPLPSPSPIGKNNTILTGTLQDLNFPPGFVPLSPIPGMANLNPYPTGFQSSSETTTTTMMSPRRDFVYPASPLARSQ